MLYMGTSSVGEGERDLSLASLSIPFVLMLLHGLSSKLKTSLSPVCNLLKNEHLVDE